MTKKDKEIIIMLITRTSMVVGWENEQSIVNFLHGYELGSINKCHFIDLIKKFIEKNYNIKYSSDGWNGQINRYSVKHNLSWAQSFKIIGLEVLAESENQQFSKKIALNLKTRIVELINRIEKQGHPWFKQDWIEEWNILCPSKNTWFKNLWTLKELRIINCINKEVKKGAKYIFDNWKPLNQFTPTEKLLDFKNQFLSAIKQ